MSLFHHRIKKIGLPPGTLLPSKKSSPVKISVIDYDETTFIEKKNVSPDDCLLYLESPANTWVEIKGTSDVTIIQRLGKHFGLHPLLVEDIASDQRPKLDDYKDSVFIVLQRLIMKNEGLKITNEQISIVLGKNFVITFEESLEDFFEPVKARLRNENSNMRKLGPDYLTYAMIDLIVDHCFVALEKIDQRYLTLEEELVSSPKKETLHKIQSAKRDIIMLRKSIWPMREVIGRFRRLDTPIIHETTKFYMHDVYDHTIQAIDTIESFRDLAASMLEIYLSNINQRLNEIIKFLTMVSTIFVPLTFITGFYGMNLSYIPLLHSIWGFPFVMLLMTGVTVTMLYYFRKRKWL